MLHPLNHQYLWQILLNTFNYTTMAGRFGKFSESSLKPQSQIILLLLLYESLLKSLMIAGINVIHVLYSIHTGRTS